MASQLLNSSRVEKAFIPAYYVLFGSRFQGEPWLYDKKVELKGYIAYMTIQDVQGLVCLWTIMFVSTHLNDVVDFSHLQEVSACRLHSQYWGTEGRVYRPLP